MTDVVRLDELEPNWLRPELRQTFSETMKFAEGDLWATLDLALSFETAEEFIRHYTLTLAGDLSRSTYRAVQDIMLRGFQEGMHPYEMAALIKNVIGMTPRQAEGLQRLRASMKLSGTNDMQIARTLKAYKDKSIARRARTIARSETIRAASAGQQLLWSRAADVGLLSRELTLRKWIVTPDDRLCPHCRAMKDVRAPLNKSFKTDYGHIEMPPLHPTCRCAMGLVFD